MRRAAVLAVAALTLSPALASATEGTAAPAPAPAAPTVQPWLADQLATVAPDATLRVAVRGTSLTEAYRAATSAGLGVQQRWDRVDTVVAVGTAAQVRAVTTDAGVERVDGDRPLATHLQTAHTATRSAEALAAYPEATGEGVSIAVIDSGIDGTHPFFAEADGSSKVVRNLKNVCGIVFFDATNETCFQDLDDTDTISVGGHGTHVAGIAAGVPVTTKTGGGKELRGSAPGAKLVGLSVGAAIGLLDAASAQYWVLEHHRNPCAPADEQDTPATADCPPIRVTNHSYGPIATEGEDQQFDDGDPAVEIQRLLVDEGVAAVWAAGNDGGDGSFAATNPAAMDPTPGVLMVASYDDGQTGDRDNALSSFSSRGKIADPTTYPDLSAPGDGITSACRPTLVICRGAPSFDGGDYQTISGTSMASPYVAGVVAQLFALAPTMTPAEVEDVLEDTAHPFVSGGAYVADDTNPGTSTSFDKGHGLVDVYAALAAAQGTTAPQAVAAAPVAPRCNGTDLVRDDAEDAAVPLVGTAAPAQDITSLSFAADATTLTVTAKIAHLTPVPAPGTTGSFYFVVWTAPDGRQLAVRHTAPDGAFAVGQYDATAVTLKAPTPVPGKRAEGPGGTITWSVPLSAIGNPVIPVDQTTDPAAVPAVQDPFGHTVGRVGVFRFTASLDRAPDGGETPDWAVCNSVPAAEPAPGEAPVEEKKKKKENSKRGPRV